MAWVMTWSSETSSPGPLAAGTFGRNWAVFLFHIEHKIKNLLLYRAPLETLENLVGTFLLTVAMNICILAGALSTILLQHPLGR
jgi:hypothetical protein